MQRGKGKAEEEGRVWVWKGSSWVGVKMLASQGTHPFSSLRPCSAKENVDLSGENTRTPNTGSTHSGAGLTAAQREKVFISFLQMGNRGTER